MVDPCTKHIKRTDDGVIDAESLDYVTSLLRAGKQSGKSEAELRALAKELREELRKSVRNEQYTRAVNKIAIERGYATVLDVYGDDPVLGLESLLANVNVLREGGGLSLDGRAAAFEKAYTGRLLDRVEQENLGHIFSNPVFDKYLSQELYALSGGATQSVSADPDVFKLAKIIHEWSGELIDEFNLNGGTLTRRDDYIVRQTHNSLTLRSVGFDKWAEDISARLNWDGVKKTLADRQLRKAVAGKLTAERSFDKIEFLKKAYATLTTGYSGDGNGAMASGSGISNIFNAQRLLPFKSADDFFEYNKVYGEQSIMNAILTQARSMGQAVAQLKTLGDNPETNFAKIVAKVSDVLKDNNRQKDLERVRDAWANGNGKLGRLLRTATGSSNIPTNIKWARFNAGLRGAFNLVFLPGTAISSVPDSALLGARASRHNNKGIMQGPVNLVKGIADDPNKVSLARRIGEYSDSMVNDIASMARVDSDSTTPRTIQRLNHLLFKYTLANRWNYANRRALLGVVMDSFGSDLKTGNLTEQKRGLYKRYDIETKELDFFAKLQTALDTPTIEPNDIRSAPRDLLRTYAASDSVYAAAKNDAGRELRLDKLRDKLAANYNTFLLGELDYGVLRRDARTRALLTQGTNPGGGAGEILRYIGQLKGYAVSFMYNHVGQAVYGRGANIGNTRGLGGMVRALQQQSYGDLGTSVFGLVGLLTFYGFISYSMTQIAAGREPPPLDDPKTWAQAMLRGGGLTVFGQFLYDTVIDDPSVTRNLFSTLAGPVPAKVDQLTRAFQRALHTGDASGLAAFGLGIVPGVNAPFVKMGADMLFMNTIKNMVDPKIIRNEDTRAEERGTPYFTR